VLGIGAEKEESMASGGSGKKRGGYWAIVAAVVTVIYFMGEPSGDKTPVATPTPTSMQYDDCVILSEGPSPTVNAPQGLDLQQLAEVGLELAGMTQSQAQEFLHNVNWQSTLGVSVPRYMRSYETVKVNGVEGTLLNMAGRRGPTYTLLWAKGGTVYSLTGYGDSGNAVSLANSLQ
jgi:hypothetical protein